ncbi:hypothetical protein [Brevundimonas subvibrioides]|uniref:hypothetical protein n=1 Tax=Brevundimonas subvibrioides TaxID=74313 RepID=UPI0022B2F9CB|nr:hypothetical protein [Brevundimonas subvibrioides]
MSVPWATVVALRPRTVVRIDPIEPDAAAVVPGSTSSVPGVAVDVLLRDAAVVSITSTEPPLDPVLAGEDGDGWGRPGDGRKSGICCIGPGRDDVERTGTGVNGGDSMGVRVSNSAGGGGGGGGGRTP